MLSVGQYLQSRKNGFPVEKYYEPAEFDDIRTMAFSLGFQKLPLRPMSGVPIMPRIWRSRGTIDRKEHLHHLLNGYAPAGDPAQGGHGGAGHAAGITNENPRRLLFTLMAMPWVLTPCLRSNPMETHFPFSCHRPASSPCKGDPYRDDN